MSFETILQQYGYIALLVGTALEGETILVIAGYLAHRGHLHLPRVIAAAALGTFAGDQAFFQIGRHSGQAFLLRHSQWQVRADRARRLLERHRITLVMGFRFMYGIRTVTPFVIGMSGFPRHLFVLLNAVSAAIWAITIGFAGYAFGNALEKWLEDAKHFEEPIILAILAIGIVVWIWHSRHVRITSRRDRDIERT